MNKKTITVFTLAMINMAAIGSVKNWPTIAEYGFKMYRPENMVVILTDKTVVS